jgi:hypothetical protein
MVRRYEAALPASTEIVLAIPACPLYHAKLTSFGESDGTVPHDDDPGSTVSISVEYSVIQAKICTLYFLRNQLVHGGSAWNSEESRAQVRDGAAILAFLMPVFVDLMMDNPT